MKIIELSQLNTISGGSQEHDHDFSCHNGDLSDNGRSVPGNSYNSSGDKYGCDGDRVKAEINPGRERTFNENGKYRGGRFTE